MITSFFAPKSGSKRPRKSSGEVDASTNKKRVVTPADSSVSATPSSSTTSSKSLTDETSTLLSFLHQHDGKEKSWKGVLEDYFYTAKFTSLATFVEKER